MRESLQALCDSYIENRKVIKSVFRWDSAYLYPVCAAIFTDKRQVARPERLKECQALLKSKVGIFSNFRSTAMIAMIAMLAVDENPADKLDKALEIYSLLKEHFRTSQYLPLAAMLLTDTVKPTQYSELAARTRHIYNWMKSEHPFLTTSEDAVFAAMLALSDRSDEEIVAETEACYHLLRTDFASHNAVQALSHVLALSDGRAKDKCSATAKLFHALKSSKHKYGTTYELATLGVLATLPAAQHAIIEDLIAVDDFLATQKGYGVFGLGKKQRLMHAGMIVTSDYIAKTDPLHTAALGSAISLIAAQQAAICAAVVATTASNTANNS